MSSWTTEIAGGVVAVTENPDDVDGLTKREAWNTAVAAVINRKLETVTVVFLTGETRIIEVTEEHKAEYVGHVLIYGPSPYAKMKKPRRYVYEGVTTADGTVVLDARLRKPTDWEACHPDAKPMPWEKAHA